MEKRILQHLFGIFLASLPISTMWLVWSESAFASGRFSVWSAFFLPFPALVLVGILGTFLFFRIREDGLISLFHNVIASLRRIPQFWILLVSVLCISTLWVEDPGLHVLSFLYLIFAGLVLSLFEDSREHWLLVGRYFAGSMIVVGCIAIFQFLFQHSVGFSFLGEPELAKNILGVAKMDIGDEKYIRAYGTFLHPNILAFFSIMAFYIANRIGWRYIKWFFLLPLLLSFSRAGFLALIISYFFAFRSLRKGEVLLALGILGLGIGVLFPFIAGRLHIFDAAFFERLEGIKTSIFMFFHHPWGVGLKHFTLWMQDYNSLQLFPWEFQPVHNVFFLMLNELGIIVSGLVTWLLWQTWRQAMPWQRQILLVFVVVALFDHYLWTSLSAQLFVLFFLLSCLKKKA